MSSAASGTPWYLDPISKSFNGGSEKGVDLRVPYHTAVTPLFPGQVRSVATGPYGQEVDVTGILNGQPVTASYVHLDLATVAPGQLVNQNTQLGLSGGQNAGGYHPASPLYSSYPHIELSLWPQGTTPYGGAPYDPMSYINAVQKSGGGVVNDAFGSTVTPPSAAASGVSASALSGLSGVLASLTSWLPQFGSNLSSNLSNNVASGVSAGVSTGISNGLSASAAPVGAGFGAGLVSGVGASLGRSLGVHTLPDVLWRAALIGGGIVLLIIVAQAISGGMVRGATTTVLNSEPVKAATNTASSVKALVK